MAEIRYFVSLKEKGRSIVSLSFKYRSDRQAFLDAVNKKETPWDLYLNIWEAE